ncbi:MAG: hypothetical protein AVDCRST_MAG68-5170 [uncultured Gemmatimonadetes bacterium]|uniref:Uncharacterized protein n=1 Tax=uncultured Gemmatimonadota bacterium TaxID=203437 RepID=A0A6J4MPL9_9BACT|nr:MAG: hypothetical protein AVDCRST_MAG68-5170 [uncultured Gemmatimonadota bacterium]
MDEEEAEALPLGRPLRVAFDDCCVGGEFVADLVERQYETDVAPDDEDFGSLTALVFSNGVTLTEWNGVTAKEES